MTALRHNGGKTSFGRNMSAGGGAAMTTTVVEARAADDRLVEDLHGGRWRARAGAARALGVAWYAIHVGLALAATSIVARLVGRPSGWAGSLGWFLGLSLVASAVLELTQRLGRRLIPLRALLRLSLAFPGVAPSRYAIALRAGNPRLLARRTTSDFGEGIGTEPEAAAVALLELVAALSRHDEALRGHSERVRAYTELVAEELGLDRGARDGLRWAGLLHDVGKLKIPAAVLNKSGPLSEDEWVLIRSHPETGAELCAPLMPWLGEWSAAVLDHHERWDGGGYPRGLTATEISLAGRIVAVADAFDVMTSARSYKRPRPVEQALAELVRCSGTQFDPTVVRAFLAISVRNLRRVMGPVAVWAQRPFGGWSWDRIVSTFGGPAVALGVAAVVGIFAPALGVLESSRPQPTHVPGVAVPGPDVDAEHAASTVAPTDGDDPDVAPAGAPEHGGTIPSDADAEDTPAATQPPTDQPSTPPTQSPEPPPQTPSVADDPSGAGGTPGAAPPEPREVGVTVDVGEGTVTVDGVGTPSSPDLTLVDAPAAGSLACGSGGICEPVRVAIPLP